MPALHVVPTADVDLAAVRSLRDAAFRPDDSSDADGAHALGGLGWAGPTAMLTPDGERPTPDADGGILVRPVTARLDPALPLVADRRDADVG